jgi:hypothetical protein
LYEAEDACHHLLLGNLGAAVDTAKGVEALVAGRERAVPALSSYHMLKAIRIRETDGIKQALDYTEQMIQAYWGRVPMPLLTMLCVENSLHKLMGTKPPKEHSTEMAVLLLKAPGRHALYRSIGIAD